MDEELARRLGSIENRLGLIEAELRLRDAPAQITPPVSTASGPPALPIAPVLPPTPIQPAESPEAIAARAENERYAANMAEAYGGESAKPPAIPAGTFREPATEFDDRGYPLNPPPAVPPASHKHATPPPLTPPPLPARDAATLEHTIGLKWTGWVGAVILIIGLALGYKFAYDQGWLKLSPIPKLAMMIASGVALLGAGEVVYRKINRLSAAGLYGAGVAVFFLAGYAGNAWYGLFDPTTAIVLMGVAAGVGILVAARADLVSVAALAIIGGNLAPLILGDRLEIDVRFLIYIACLQWMALGLCAWRQRAKWWSLRGLTFVTTAIWMTAVCTNGDVPNHKPLLLVFAFDFWLCFQAELLFSTVRAIDTQKRASLDKPAGIVHSLFATMAFMVWLLEIFDGSPRVTQGEWLLGLAAFLGLLSYAVGNIRSGALMALARGYRVQAVVAIFLAIPVLLHGPSALFGWIILAAALAILGAQLRLTLPVVGAALVWCWSIFVSVMWAHEADSTHVWLTIAGQPIIASLCVALALAVVGHLIAAVIHAPNHRDRPKRPPVLGYFFDLAAMIVFGLALIYFTRSTFATWTLIAYAWALFGLSSIAILSHLGPVAIGLLGMTAIKWVGMDLLLPRLEPKWAPEPGTPFLNARAAVGYVLAASVGVMGWLIGRRNIDEQSASLQSADLARRSDNALSVAFTVALLVLGVGLSFEIDFANSRSVLAHHATVNVQLFQTMLWCGIVVAWLMTLRLSLRTTNAIAQVGKLALVAALLLTVKFVFIDILINYFDDARPTMAIGFNLQVLAAVVVGALLCVAAGLSPASGLTGLASLAVPILIWVTGTAEIDRYAVLQHHGPEWIVRQVGWSIYWASLAVVTLIVGFGWKWKALRYLSLGLLAATLAKVVLVDLSGAGTGWRILSFLGVGLLLLATSVLYGKFSPKTPPAE